MKDRVVRITESNILIFSSNINDDYVYKFTIKEFLDGGSAVELSKRLGVYDIIAKRVMPEAVPAEPATRHRVGGHQEDDSICVIALLFIVFLVIVVFVVTLFLISLL